MTRAELQALLDAAGITDVTLENTEHPTVVRLRIPAPPANQERARRIIEKALDVNLLHGWIDAKTTMLILRVELLDGD